MSTPSSKPPDWSNVYRIASMGYEPVIAVVVTGAMGFGIDYLAGTRPWFLIGGLMVGIVLGLYNFVREVSRASRGDAAASDRGKGK